MSKNNKNARHIAAAKVMPKNRSAAARARREAGKPTSCRTTKTSKKKNAWWQKFPSYGAWLRGNKKQKEGEGS